MLSKEFGWTPDQINELTDEVILLYIDRMRDTQAEIETEMKKGNTKSNTPTVNVSASEFEKQFMVQPKRKK